MIKTLPNEVIISEVARWLETVERVVLPVKGFSMLPFIIGGRERVELRKASRSLRVGDVVLAWVNGTHYVVHRIVGIEGDRLLLMGDGNLVGTEYCGVDEVVALATHVVTPDGGRRYLYTTARTWAARCWRRLLPVRRWLLAVYRRTFLKLNMTL